MRKKPTYKQILEGAQENLLDLLLEKRSIHYLEVAMRMGVSPTRAWQLCKIVALRYPENIKLQRGVLTLINHFVPEPPPDRLKKALVEVQQAKRELLTELAENHLRHIEEALEKADWESIRKEVRKMRSVLDKELGRRRQI